MPFISLIIPVYKVEKYIRQCIDSVINQNVFDLEIILIDDGSPDNSGAICDEYSNKYKNIRVIHKRNGGASSARNAGIRIAKGSYFMFMDSDDWWNPDVNFLEILNYVKKNSNVDMFLLNSMDYYENQGFFTRNDHNNFGSLCNNSIEEYYQSLINSGNFEVSACTKIIKSSTVIEKKLFFKEGSTGEDNEWMMRVLRVIDSVDVINKELYICRCDRLESITHTISRKNILDMLLIVKDSIDYYNSTKDKRINKLKDKELSFASYLWFTSLGLTHQLNREDKMFLKSHFNFTKEVCQYSNSKKTKICNYIYKVFGYRITIWLLGNFIKYKDRFTKTKV